MKRRAFLQKAAGASLLFVLTKNLIADNKDTAKAAEETADYVKTLIPEFTKAAQRERIPIHDYLTEQKRILTSNPVEIADFVQNYTPFKENARVTQTFNSVHGPIDITIPCETFIPFGNKNLDKWPLHQIYLAETGGTLSALHTGLGDWNNSDPENIKRLASIAIQDISIQSPYTQPIKDHLAKAHGIILKNGNRDSEAFKDMKDNAKEHFIIG